MTLRDYFAAKAFPALISFYEADAGCGPKDMAKAAYEYADALLTERENKS